MILPSHTGYFIQTLLMIILIIILFFFFFHIIAALMMSVLIVNFLLNIALQAMRKPFLKFICNSASYFFFLFLLILVSQRIEDIMG